MKPSVMIKMAAAGVLCISGMRNPSMLLAMVVSALWWDSGPDFDEDVPTIFAFS